MAASSFTRSHHPARRGGPQVIDRIDHDVSLRPAGPPERFAADSSHSDGTVAGWEQKIELPTGVAGPTTPNVDAQGGRDPAFRALSGRDRRRVQAEHGCGRDTKKGPVYLGIAGTPSFGFQPTIDVIANKG